MERDYYIWKCVKEWLCDEKMLTRAAACILYAMAAEGLSYREALLVYADYIDDAPERIHSQLCYSVLCTDYDSGPETFFQTFLEERDFEN